MRVERFEVEIADPLKGRAVKRPIPDYETLELADLGARSAWSTSRSWRARSRAPPSGGSPAWRTTAPGSSARSRGGSCALGESSLSSWLSRKLLKPLQIGMQDMPERMKLTVVLRREEDGGYSAQCLELPGCVSEGDTWEEALENIKEAILGYLEAFPEEIEKLKEEEKETVGAVV